MMDADCEPHPLWLSRAVGIFDDPRVVAVSGPYDYHDSSPSFRSVSLLTQRYIYPVFNHLFQLTRSGGTMSGGNSIFRASALKKIGGFDTDIVFYGDETDAARRLSKHGRIVFDRCLIMRTSGRRFRDEGTVRISYNYIYAFFKGVLWPKKSKSQKSS